MTLANTLPVTLGGLLLEGLEVPSSFDRIGRIRFSAHQVIGGGHALQVTGTDTLRRRLIGTFIGGDASERAQLLEAMRDEAAPVLLTIGVWTELVLVTSVTIRYSKRGSVIDFQIEAEVIDNTASAYIDTTETILSASLAGLQLASSVISDLAPNAAAFASVQTELSGSVSAVGQALYASSSTSVGLSSPGTALMGVIASSEVASHISADGDLVSSASALSQATSNAGTLAVATRSGAYVNQAAGQLANLNGTVFTPVITS